MHDCRAANYEAGNHKKQVNTALRGDKRIVVASHEKIMRLRVTNGDHYSGYTSQSLNVLKFFHGYSLLSVFRC